MVDRYVHVGLMKKMDRWVGWMGWMDGLDGWMDTCGMSKLPLGI